jgi:hypothetical protein
VPENWARPLEAGYGEGMNRILLTLATASIFVVGCGRAALDHEAVTPAPASVEPEAPKAQADKAAPAQEEKAEIGADGTPAAAPETAGRMPGDFVVYRFTGSFRKAPLTLSQKVVARAGSILTVDVSLTDGDKKDEMRVRIDEASGNQVLGAALLDKGIEKPSTIAVYEALMAKTTLSADANEAVVGTEDVTLDVGGAQIPAKRTTYRVRVGKKAATMSTFESASFAWGDVGGEIASGGKLLYKAQVIEAGHAGEKASAAR